jgi:hypothetical protein
MTRPNPFAIAIFALSLIGGQAAAATLTVLQGSVMVNRGSGYQPVTGSTEVAPGDQVIAGPDSQAMLAYPDGTSALVEPGDVVSVAEGGAVPAGEAAVSGALDTTTVVIGGVVVAGGVGLALAASGGGGKDQPASP